jgi:rRNA processing protein Krr1/Pno1
MTRYDSVPLVLADADGRSVAIEGTRYDFRSAVDARAFMRVVATGAPPRLAYALLNDQRIFSFLDH